MALRDQASWVQWKVLECHLKPPEFPGGQGRGLKGLSRGVVWSELDLESHNVEMVWITEQWEAEGPQGIIRRLLH